LNQPLRSLATLLLISALTGCASMQHMAIDKMGDALASQQAGRATQGLRAATCDFTLFAAVMLITYVPALTTWLPHLFMR
jgi:hypothetical protein